MNSPDAGRAAEKARIADITEEWIAAAVVSATPEAIVVCDAGGVIRLWNDGAQRMFGYSTDEALGQNLDIIIPEKLRKRHWDGYHKTMATGQTRYGDQLLSVPATHQDGHRLSIEFSVALLQHDGRIVGISAIMREVTERRNEERALRARLAEVEARLGELESAVS
ncbi:PAS domain-containing protein [Mycobacterium simiae]|uniref:PAS domain-containing protein n=1 Tax=Mycobacterium simiae TaxID=1784 RepID=UPI0004047129|nr:PAS domain S-box protein [Mycobacterium simiae]PLV49712.1 PAS sensor protein [Mycobacterium tuberculosis variant microti OV254]BBX39176.1 transcriptional regulator [Mycobacterium simiae]